MSNIHRTTSWSSAAGQPASASPCACARTSPIAVVSKRELHEGSTFYAQGGISAVLDPNDSVDSHIQDTIKAGGALCDRKVVRDGRRERPGLIRWLLDQGVSFTRDDRRRSRGGYHLTREGGHTHRRVIHAADATGKEVEST